MEAKVTISTPNSEWVQIAITDSLSGIRFAELRMEYVDFAKAITGNAFQAAELTVRDLKYVGKRRITEDRKIVCPLKTYEKDKLAMWLVDNAQEEGWLINTYLGSQKSVTTVEGGTLLRYRVTKYVDE